MSENKRDIQISKALAYLLRHGAVKEGLPIDNNGYVSIDLLLRHNRLKSLHCTLQDVERVVANNAKKRFHIQAFQDGQTAICATQGHSLAQVTPSDEFLHKVCVQTELPSKLVHGTSFSSLKLILQSGFLKKMRRNHIHLAAGVTGSDDNVVSGMRVSSNVFIYLKVKELCERLQVFRSLNNVYLTPEDIPIDLFQCVVLIGSEKSKSTVHELKLALEQLHVPCEVSEG
ncbi:LAFA_0F03554g1_1 [Lachancea sp. 'fantastica']|nr:LAFA_0F03554g1_1 [Lachancea sp. 'fantastica']